MSKPIKVPSNNTIERTPRKLQYYIEEEKEVVDDFERMVKQKYGFTKGIMGYEVIKAFKLYMALLDFECYGEIQPYTFVENDRTHKPLMDNKKLLAGYIYDNYYKGDRITFRELQDIIIKEYRRSDKRTHQAYVDALEANEILCRCDDIDRYDFYYYHEIPALSLKDNLHGDLLTVYNHIPDKGVIRIEQLKRITGWDDEKLGKHLRVLEDDKLIARPTPGVFTLPEIEEEE